MSQHNKPKSGGPRTIAGKQSSSRNATTHGGRSERHTILEGESEDDFLAIAKKYAEAYPPENDLDVSQIRTAAEREWHLLRCERNLTGTLEDLMSEKPNARDWTKDDQHSLALMQRYHTSADRQLRNAIQLIESTRKNRLALRKLEATTLLKQADVHRKISIADKGAEVAAAKLDAMRVEALKQHNASEWDLLVLRYNESRKDSNPEAQQPPQEDEPAA